jgi:ribosomal protein S8E
MFTKTNANLNAVELTQAELNPTGGVVKRTRIVQVVGNPFREVYKATGIK